MSNDINRNKVTEMLANILVRMCSGSRSNSFGYVELYQALRRANEKGVFGEVPPIMPCEFERAIIDLQDAECLAWRDRDSIDVDPDRLRCVALAFNRMGPDPHAEFID